MIYFPKSRYQVSYEAPVATGQSVTAEGQLLVASVTAGVGGVKPSAGSSETIVGFAVSDMLTILSFPKVEDFVVSGGASTTLVLSRTPSASTLFIYNVTDAAALAETTDWTLSNDTVTWVTSQQNDTVRCFYHYAPTTIEAQALQGDIRPGGAPGSLLGQVGVIKNGVIYTSEYDTSVNWLATNPAIKSAANGRVTIGGGGTALRGYVVSAPNASGPDGAFLGIEFNAD